MFRFLPFTSRTLKRQQYLEIVPAQVAPTFWLRLEFSWFSFQGVFNIHRLRPLTRLCKRNLTENWRERRNHETLNVYVRVWIEHACYPRPLGHPPPPPFVYGTLSLTASTPPSSPNKCSETLSAAKCTQKGQYTFDKKNVIMLKVYLLTVVSIIEWNHGTVVRERTLL